mgnify:CR=1 FL=1
MKAVLKWLGWVLAGAVVIHVLAVWLAPSIIMAIAISRMEERAGAPNTLFHAPRITEDAREVVRPAPDLAYSVCTYDVSSGPVRLVLPKTQTYSSVSMFDDTTDNFFALNDRDVTGAAQEVWVTAVDAEAAVAPENVIVVTAPTDRGMVLFRRVIPSNDAWPRIDAERRQAVCEPLQSAS